MIERMYNVKEVADILHKSPKTIRRYIREGVLNARRSGKKSFVIAESELKTYMKPAISEEERVKRLVELSLSKIRVV